jgi:hypothetical protein
MTINRITVLAAFAAAGFLTIASAVPSYAGTVVRDHRTNSSHHGGFGGGYGHGCRRPCNPSPQGGVTVTQTGTGKVVPTKVGPAPGRHGGFGGTVRDHRGRHGGFGGTVRDHRSSPLHFQFHGLF